MRDKPLVSVCLFVYNRPEQLERAIERTLSQSYKNLDVIISDNCSPDPRNKEIILRYAKKDKRIRYYFQKKNIGPFLNCKFTLMQSKGKYFLPMSDDDIFEDDFIELCVNELEKKGGRGYVAATMDTQYTHNYKKLEYFSLIKPFYKFYRKTSFGRLSYMLKYGEYAWNITYSVFRTELLKNEKLVFKSWMKFRNEIYFLWYVFVFGNVKVIPKIGIYKEVSMSRYNLKRDFKGKKNKNKAIKTKVFKLPFRFIRSFYSYVLVETYKATYAIFQFDFNVFQKIYLIWIYFLYLVGRKIKVLWNKLVNFF